MVKYCDREKKCQIRKQMYRINLDFADSFCREHGAGGDCEYSKLNAGTGNVINSMKQIKSSLDETLAKMTERLEETERILNPYNAE